METPPTKKPASIFTTSCTGLRCWTASCCCRQDGLCSAVSALPSSGAWARAAAGQDIGQNSIPFRSLMLIARSPVRISFAGGGTDLPAYFEQYGGAVLSTAIDKYFYTVL